jgi:hypothetical protein
MPGRRNAIAAGRIGAGLAFDRRSPSASTRAKRMIRAGSRGSVSPGQPVPTRCAIAIDSAAGAAKRSGSSQ